jgi:allantoin racemase
MRLLLYNPNTDRSLTTKLASAVRTRLAPSDALIAVTSEIGEAFVNSEDSVAAAGSSASETLSGRADDCEAILLACFGDLGVDDLRRKLKRPVISLSDAFFAVAPFLGRRIGIVTTSPFWADRIKTEARRKGTTFWIADVHSLGAGTQSAALDQCRAIIGEFASGDRCDAVVLAGAALIALVDELSADSPLPIVDALVVGVGLCRAASEVL